MDSPSAQPPRLTMHEASLAIEVIALLERQRSTLSRITRIVLDIGALGCVDEDALRTALLAALPGTLAEGATIEMHTIPAQARCLQCATVYEPPDRIEPCPHCGSARKQWLSGQSLTLRSVEGESCRA